MHPGAADRTSLHLGAITIERVLARATRRAVLEHNCESGRIVLTAHFPSPSMGHVTARGAAFGFRYL